MMIGCDDKKETPSGAPAPVPQASEAAADATKAKAEDASERAKAMAKEAGTAAKTEAEAASDALKKGADAAAESVAANPAAGDATAKIQQVLDYIRDKKLDLAETTLKGLEDNKASLPPAVQTQLASARTMLDAAKKGAAAAPAAPAAPK
jgi:hypothetical protein